MKSIIILVGAVLLIFTSGCVVHEHRGGGDFHEWHGHGYGYHSGYYHHDPDPGVSVRIHD